MSEFIEPYILFLISKFAKTKSSLFPPTAEEHMYMVVNKFILGTQFLDLKRVPDFFKLFYSSDLEVMKHQI